MNTIRVSKTSDFTVMSNHHLRNKNLTLKAKGLQSFMLSLPDNWDLSVKGLEACLIEGKDSIYSALSELIDNGYVLRIEIRKSGKFMGYDYEVHEIPINSSVSPEREKPDTEKPDTEKPDTEKPQQINTNSNNDLIKEELTLWRTDFNVYLDDLRKVYKNLIADTNFITLQEKFHPGIDIKLSLEKACKNFWATEAGWKHKKGKKSKTIDWKSTLTNAIELNKVRKSFNNESGTNLSKTYTDLENYKREGYDR